MNWSKAVHLCLSPRGSEPDGDPPPGGDLGGVAPERGGGAVLRRHCALRCVGPTHGSGLPVGQFLGAACATPGPDCACHGSPTRSALGVATADLRAVRRGIPRG
jgi:hypothetical protein